MSRPSLDEFNEVTDTSRLTHQNVLYLQKIATQDYLGLDEKEYEQRNTKSEFDVGVIGKSSTISTAKSILNFLKNDTQKSSIAFCDGEANDDGTISGGTHWIGIHLRKREEDDKTLVDAYHLNSTDDQQAHLNKNQIFISDAIKYIKDNKDKEDFQKEFEGYEEIISKIVNDNITLNPLQPIECAIQDNGNDCGYHAIYNLTKIHKLDSINTYTKIDNEHLKDFITTSRLRLKNHFNNKKTDISQETTDQIAKLQAKLRKKHNNESLNFITNNTQTNEGVLKDIKDIKEVFETTAKEYTISTQENGTTKETKEKKLYYADISKVEFTKNNQDLFNKKGALNDIFMINFRGCTFKNIDFSKVENFETAGFTNCKFENCILPDNHKFQHATKGTDDEYTFEVGSTAKQKYEDLKNKEEYNKYIDVKKDITALYKDKTKDRDQFKKEMSNLLTGKKDDMEIFQNERKEIYNESNNVRPSPIVKDATAKEVNSTTKTISV